MFQPTVCEDYTPLPLKRTLGRPPGAVRAQVEPVVVAADLRSAPSYGMLRVRVSKIGKISKILQIFGGLVLGCIKTKFCKKICV